VTITVGLKEELAMNHAKRKTLSVGVGAILSAAFTSSGAATASRYQAVVFDGFPIFDVRPVAARTESYFPGQGAALVQLWRSRQFEYQWLSCLMDRYVDFGRATRDSLEFAVNAMGLTLSPATRDALVGMYQNLSVWPDVANALQSLRAKGLRIGMLSNMTQSMLDQGLGQSGLSTLFEHVISTDSIHSFKPSRASYQLAVRQFALQPVEVLFVAFAGWDAVGAKSFGYPTYWMNRVDAPAETLGIAPDRVGRSMSELIEFIG
jgi:2-haloacid dehalogenase